MYIDMKWNEFNSECGRVILEALSKNRLIQEFTLVGNRISNDVLNEIYDIVDQNRGTYSYSYTQTYGNAYGLESGSKMQMSMGYSSQAQSGFEASSYETGSAQVSGATRIEVGAGASTQVVSTSVPVQAASSSSSASSSQVVSGTTSTTTTVVAPTIVTSSVITSTAETKVAEVKEVAKTEVRGESKEYAFKYEVQLVAMLEKRTGELEILLGNERTRMEEFKTEALREIKIERELKVKYEESLMRLKEEFLQMELDFNKTKVDLELRLSSEHQERINITNNYKVLHENFERLTYTYEENIRRLEGN
jgi:hypothetical protein